MGGTSIPTPASTVSVPEEKTLIPTSGLPPVSRRGCDLVLAVGALYKLYGLVLFYTPTVRAAYRRYLDLECPGGS